MEMALKLANAISNETHRSCFSATCSPMIPTDTYGSLPNLLCFLHLFRFDSTLLPPQRHPPLHRCAKAQRVCQAPGAAWVADEDGWSAMSCWAKTITGLVFSTDTKLLEAFPKKPRTNSHSSWVGSNLSLPPPVIPQPAHRWFLRIHPSKYLALAALRMVPEKHRYSSETLVQKAYKKRYSQKDYDYKTPLS